jgi:hypothetical protein
MKAPEVRRGDLVHEAKDQSFRYRKDLGLPNQVCLFRRGCNIAKPAGAQRQGMVKQGQSWFRRPVSATFRHGSRVGRHDRMGNHRASRGGFAGCGTLQLIPPSGGA